MRFIFLGPPGIGKGTIAARVIGKLNIPQISTGDLLRSAVRAGTGIGIKAREHMNSGGLVPDEIVITLLKERLSQDDCKDGFILDGFPRTIPQAKALEANGITVDGVINFVASKHVIIQRLSGRRVCKRCGAIFHLTNIPPKVEDICDRCNGELYQRKDDTPEIIVERLEVYKKQTEPLIGYYEGKGLLHNVAAEGSHIPDLVDNTLAVMQQSDQ
ncbi:MAG: adenylate kinase [Nanoarchaeota archaeon]|nr:adenylate kinase [Nanoarchaeota archaeon]